MNTAYSNVAQISYKDLKLELAIRLAKLGTQEIKLTSREFEILVLLTQTAGEVVTKQHILDSIDQEGNIFEGTLATHVSNLRHKLRRASGNRFNIASVYGRGYRLTEEKPSLKSPISVPPKS